MNKSSKGLVHIQNLSDLRVSDIYYIQSTTTSANIREYIEIISKCIVTREEECIFSDIAVLTGVTVLDLDWKVISNTIIFNYEFYYIPKNIYPEYYL